jgi:hypothetical protein
MAQDYKVATEKLYVGTALAHNPGDEVPAENVEANGWGDSVTGPGTKAAKAAKEPAEGGLAQGISDQV